jgi:hypothetical protein
MERFLSTGYDTVGATIRRFQGKTVSVLTEKDMSAGMEVLV